MLPAGSVIGVFLSFLLPLGGFRVSAQAKPAEPRFRLVSAQEGEAIVQAAWDLRHGLMNPKPDCSHFVQAVYARAGFPYEYAVTREVFAGINSFRIVRKPQPGDVVVWQGHIGIVIDPGDHSFYSSVLSGFAIENYQSHYWAGRGNPRFYRFLVKVNGSSSAPQPLLARAKQIPPPSGQAPVQQKQLSLASSKKPGLTAPVTVAKSSQPPSQPAAQAKVEGGAGMRDAAVHNEIAPSQKPGSVAPVAVAKSSQTPNRPAEQMKVEGGAGMRDAAMHNDVASSQKPGLMAPVPMKAAKLPAGPSPQPARVEAVTSVQPKAEVAAVNTIRSDAGVHGAVFVTSRATPSRMDVLAAIQWSAKDNGERLLRDRRLDSQPSVVVVDHFRIVSVDVQGNSGLADVEVTEIATVQYGKPNPNRSVARQHMVLSRQEQGWVLLMPQDKMYVKRQIAAKGLSNQVAALSQAPSDQLQAKKTVKILHAPSSDKSPGANAVGSN